MGATVGISVGQAIYTSALKRKVNRIPDLTGTDTSPAALAESVRTLQHLPVSQCPIITDYGLSVASS
jgi:hypothetical protein